MLASTLCSPSSTLCSGTMGGVPEIYASRCCTRSFRTLRVLALCLRVSKFSWSSNDVLPPPVSCCTQSCCSNSATAAISVITLGVLTGLQGAQPLQRLGCGRVVLIVLPSNITHGDYCSGTIVWYIGTLTCSTQWLSIVHALLGLIKTSTRLVFAILSGVCSRVHKLVMGSFYPHKIMLSL